MEVSFEKTVGLVVLNIGILIGIDVLADMIQGVTATHLVFEGLGFLLCIALVGYLIWNNHELQKTRYETLHAGMSSLEKERDQWKKQAGAYIHGLGREIENQFVAWGVSDSEKEIGFLILKGLSHKEIAAIRETSEKTVRQQATSIYAKSGVAGKGELISFFLEDLMMPKGLQQSKKDT